MIGGAAGLSRFGEDFGESGCTTPSVLCCAAGLRGSWPPAVGWARKLIVGDVGLSDQRAELMVVPDVGIIVGDDDGSRAPVGILHNGVDRVHQVRRADQNSRRDHPDKRWP